MEENNLKRECWCGFNVHSATNVVMWIQIVLSAMMGIFLFPLLPIVIVSVLLCGMVLYGMDNKRPGFYVPYLILTVIMFVLQIGVLTFHAVKDLLKKDQQRWFVILTAFLIVATIIGILYYWYFVVPYRSYKLLEFELQEQRKQARIDYERGNQQYQPYVINTTAPPPYTINTQNVPPPDYTDKV
ncbi:hypothetical protein M3Y97_01076100 [Aphelenchoides bicaudatus]|nr:hypothetical protein M3Y97_01076100 [Aphelenchoides bicaudatus]